MRRIERENTPFAEKTRKVERNFTLFKDPMGRLNLLLVIGSQNPPLKVREFIQRIRLYEDKKMSYEYKIFKKLCPVYAKSEAPTINKVFPFECYYNDKKEKHLWTGAIVKLVLEEKTEKEYLTLTQQYYDDSQVHNRAVFNQSGVEEIKEKEEAYQLAKENYLKIVEEVNRLHSKNLNVTLTFRGLLTFMYSAYEYRVERIESKKGKQETEINEKRNVIKRRKERLKVLTEKIYKVIRNPYVIKEAPFLIDSQLHESMGFDVIGTLLEISVELIGQLHIDANKDQYLLVRATERYLAEFDRFFFVSLYDSATNVFSMHMAFLQPIKNPVLTDEQTAGPKAKELVVRLNTYRKRMAEIMRMWKLDELCEIDILIQKSSMLDNSFKHDATSKPDVEGSTTMIFSIPREDKDA